MNQPTNESRTISLSEPDWNIDKIVSELRAIRNDSLAARQRIGKPVKLPSRAALSGIVEGLTAAMFPNRLSAHVLVGDNVATRQHEVVMRYSPVIREFWRLSIIASHTHCTDWGYHWSPGSSPKSPIQQPESTFIRALILKAAFLSTTEPVS